MVVAVVLAVGLCITKAPGAAALEPPRSPGADTVPAESVIGDLLAAVGMCASLDEESKVRIRALCRETLAPYEGFHADKAAHAREDFRAFLADRIGSAAAPTKVTTIEIRLALGDFAMLRATEPDARTRAGAALDRVIAGVKVFIAEELGDFEPIHRTMVEQAAVERLQLLRPRLGSYFEYRWLYPTPKIDTIGTDDVAPWLRSHHAGTRVRLVRTKIAGHRAQGKDLAALDDPGPATDRRPDRLDSLRVDLFMLGDDLASHATALLAEGFRLASRDDGRGSRAELNAAHDAEALELSVAARAVADGEGAEDEAQAMAATTTTPATGTDARGQPLPWPEAVRRLLDESKIGLRYGVVRVPEQFDRATQPSPAKPEGGAPAR